MRLVITGTPCTGKTTLAQFIASANKWPLIDLNALVKKEKLFLRREGKEFVADLPKLRKRVLRLICNKKHFVVEGHLACEFPIPCDAVIVLRCNPSVLERGMKKRGYARKKIDGNLVCEFLDYCGAKAEQNFKRAKIIEVDATKPVSAQKIAARLKGGKSDFVDWMPLLLGKRFSKLANA